MGSILSIIGILVFSVSLWLWRLSSGQVSRFELRSLHLPAQEMRIYLIKRIDYLLEIILINFGTIIRYILHILSPPFIFIVLFIIFKWTISNVDWMGFFWIGLLIFTIFGIIGLISRFKGLNRSNIVLLDRYLFHKPGLELVGEIKIPRKVYVNNSDNILIDLRRERIITSLNEDSLSTRPLANSLIISSIRMQFQYNVDLEQFLEVELQAAAITVDPEKKQRHILSSNMPKLTYRWNCYFANSGKHTIDLVFNLVGSEIVELGAIQRTIKVVQLDHLTQRQVRILASVAAIAGFIATLIGITTKIPDLLHIFGIH